MTDSDQSVMEFPCDFPIKAMGLATDPVEAILIEIVRRHLPHQQSFDTRQRSSKNGKYVSITVTLKALNREQLDAVYIDLSAHPQILMSL